MSDAAGRYPLFRNRSLMCLIGAIALLNAVKVVRALIYGWYLYDGGAGLMHLGGIALAEAFFYITTNPVGGWLADHRGRRKQAFTLIVIMTVLTAALIWLVMQPISETVIAGLYLVMSLFGIARGLFASGALNSLLALSVPKAAFKNANALSQTATQAAYLALPLVTGIIYHHAGGGMAAAGLFPLLAISAVLMAFVVEKKLDARDPSLSRWRDMTAGFRLIFKTPALSGVVFLDIIAVAFGGMAGILPVIAKDVLNAGPDTLGLLRAALPAGALISAAWMTRETTRAGMGAAYGAIMAVFALAIVTLSLSASVPLVFAALLLCGFCDNYGVILRQTALRLSTPDIYLGRVTSARIFFGSSATEINAFQLAATAAAIGLGPALWLSATAVMAAGLWGAHHGKKGRFAVD